MCHKVTYAGINQEVSNDDAFNTLLDVSIENQIPHLHECGGQGNCTTCRVRVINGMQNLTSKT